MRILITNDDGIHAPGLAVLEEIARALSDDVWVVAPETDQSGKAHSLTLSDPLRLREIDARHVAVRGTPTDCVIMGLRHILPARPDLVLSGVNRGANIADDVTYSGTVAGAMEGTILGVPSIALSQAFGWPKGSDVPWDTARTHGPDVIRRLIEAGIPDGVLMNVNFPNRAPDAVTGVIATAQGERNGDLIHVDERMDNRGFPYYWIAYRPKRLEPLEGTDLWALDQGAISVTPLRLDLTDHGLRQKLAHTFR
ncbi:5'/3'-nucleotidase SurE [Prosthecomicrobium hirschii]|jgi:5'-nucleotidase|uniref:5'/3'-nucleotidase SurE n=1 Tax=Prosthecodimorpha hirschii TaxID=665126 RepID=UPI00112D6486|nr:5'/3'-nucleotidase SurE [Prosthecomicrobium hirschii]TPQ50711.1 5'/3'-nucleotidase SurE [Prosthecomicrobium hirschii]